MPTLKDHIKNDIIIKEATSLMGMVEGKVTVCNGANLQLHGLVVGSVVLEKGSEVFLHGMVNGEVTNNGGSLYVFGTVNGRVIENAGSTKTDRQGAGWVRLSYS